MKIHRVSVLIGMVVAYVTVGLTQLVQRRTDARIRANMCKFAGHSPFDLATLKSDRNGLGNIAARMRHLGGRGKVQSVLGRGTRVELELLVRVLRGRAQLVDVLPCHRDERGDRGTVC